MAQPTNTYDTYDATGIREDLIDDIYRISPTETPFQTAAGRVKATATYHEHQLEELSAVSDNKVIDGDDATLDASVDTTRVGNFTQISDKTASVSGSVEAVIKAGRKNEMARQQAIKTLELKRDMENACVGLNNARVAGNSSTARELASVQSFITTNVDKAGDGSNPTGDGTDARGDGTERALTETMLKNVLQSIWTEGGNPHMIMAGGFNKVVMSGFTGMSTRFDKGEDKTLNAAVDIYNSDFGKHTFVANRFSRTRDVLCLDMSKWKLAFLRPFQSWDLAKTGDTERKQILVEYTLQASQQKASGIVADLATS